EGSSLSPIKCLVRLLMSNLDDKATDASDKMQAGLKAAGKKMTDPDRDTETEYNVEKAKEKADDL
ncbi:MAG: hypothetical protein ACJ70P_01380, partial [Nitrososphaera sp.]